ncbi:heat shock transcription factor, X-linked member 4 [Ochotona princeps]|uniref:heat shock transcription factor, X-linked member 4 n=1 Tax=Ochotona princeps TaxID=9978 RepID=UPI0027147F45|nr:heat shock transcription factor, X-linked member 4 [Ochotona princeps]
MEGSGIPLGLSFPRKLWIVVEDPAFESVCWNKDGDAVVIEDDLFQREVLLQEEEDRIFETDSLKAFIRQLSLYGFSKIRPRNTAHGPENRGMLTYRNKNFQRDKPALLMNIQSKGDQRRFSRQALCGSSAKSKELATRRSPHMHPNREDEEAERRAQEEATSVQRPSASHSLMFCGIWSMSNLTVRPLRIYTAQEPRGPSGEATASNVVHTPLSPTATHGAGEAASSPAAYPDYDSMISLYNTCYSTLVAALNTMTSNEPPEQEASADDRRVICERVRDDPPL